MQQAQPLAQGRPSASRHGKGISIVEVSLIINLT